MTEPRRYSSLDKLNPIVKEKAQELLRRAKDQNLKVGAFETFRTHERSNYLSSEGVGVSGGKSYHNYGLAVDIVFKDAKGWTWKASNEDWEKLGAIGRELGFEWGGDWGSLDKAHFQYTFNMSIKDLMDGKKPPTKQLIIKQIMKTIDISRWNSRSEDQMDDPRTVKYCQTYAFTNILEHEYNKHICYMRDIKKSQAKKFCEKYGLNLDEILIQAYAKEFVFYNPFRKEPVSINAMKKIYKDNPIPGTSMVIDQIKSETDKSKMLDFIRNCLASRIPVYVGVRGKYKHELIDGVWTTVYTAKSWGGSHAMMIDKIDKDGKIYCENSTNPRAIIETVDAIKVLYAFSFKQA